ncbi:uncharacterized protein LOC131153004 [Malania oleifera]|uniref:uncharacterized protein LOC131153004 n=1 Tax=Malania oleifera TaxID=397392 RepID=UPI0025AE5150|nr:uncharacterized protein LOC131153004 [Malania oleifera]
MTSLKPSSRYTSFDNRSSTSSRHSEPSSSAELKNPTKKQSSLKRLTRGSSSPASQHRLPDLSSGAAKSTRALAKTTQTGAVKGQMDQQLSMMMRKLVDTKSNQKAAVNRTALIIPSDLIAEDLKKTAKKGWNFTDLHRKMFGKGRGSGSGSSDVGFREKKALTEGKANTRTLAMVLRSERELLSQNQELEAEMARLKLTLEEKNNEVEKLKDLCLKQRAEIKSLKSAVLFPDEMNSQLQELFDKQGSELKQAKQIIPTLQRQVTSLTGQLQCLAQDLAEVKADKNSLQGCYEGHFSSPKTPAYDSEPANSLEFSSADPKTPGSPDDMFLNDLNPCLTPYSLKKMSLEFEGIGYDSLQGQRLPGNSFDMHNDIDFDQSHVKKVSKSSDNYQSNQGRAAVRVPHRSEKSEHAYQAQMQHKLF